MKEKVALVVGASSGFGKEAALAHLAEGFTVYAVARRLAPMEEVGRAGARLLEMDVTSESTLA